MLPMNQRRFLIEYVGNGYDSSAAVLASYPNVKTAESARVMGSRILNAPGMVMLLTLHFGDSPLDAFCRQVARMIKSGRLSKQQLEAIKLIADVRGFRQPWTPRYAKQLKDGKSNTRQAVKRREQREAKKAAQPKKNLLGDFES